MLITTSLPWVTPTPPLPIHGSLHTPSTPCVCLLRALSRYNTLASEWQRVATAQEVTNALLRAFMTNVTGQPDGLPTTTLTNLEERFSGAIGLLQAQINGIQNSLSLLLPTPDMPPYLGPPGLGPPGLETPPPVIDHGPPSLAPPPGFGPPASSPPPVPQEDQMYPGWQQDE